MKKSNEVFNPTILNFKQLTFPQIVLSLILAVMFVCARQTKSIAFSNELPLRVHFIDVGYGDAILIQFPNSRNLMIDAGEKQYSSRLQNYLRSLNIKDIDQAVITHPHNNHFDGFFGLLDHISIHHLYINGDKNSEEGYEGLLEKFKNKSVPVTELRRGMTLNDQDSSVEFEVLHPEDLTGSPNGNSIVLWLKYDETSILFMGDIGPDEQVELLDQYNELRQVDSIKIPHHGGPLSDKLIQNFKDKNFIISTGPNPWGLPDSRVIEKLEGSVYRTDKLGTIILESDGVSVSINTIDTKKEW